MTDKNKDELHEFVLEALLARYKIIAFTPNGSPVYIYTSSIAQSFFIFKEWREAASENTWKLAVRISIPPLLNIILKYLLT